MALPTGTTRGSGLSRSEAAIAAWKKRARHPKLAGGLDPKIAARVKEILAGKVKGKKGKAKGAKPKAAKNTPEQKNKNRAAIAKQGGMGDLEGTLVRVGAGMARGGQDLEPEKHDELVKKGLAKRHADGSLTLSPAGRKWKSAADKGDAEGANAALSEASAAGADSAAKEQSKSAAKQDREKTKAAKLAERATKQQKMQQDRKAKAGARKKIASEKAKARAAKDAAKLKAKAAPAPVIAKPPAAQPAKVQPKAKKAIDMTELAIKAGARHSKMDASHLDEASRHLHAAGAVCPDCAPDPEDDNADEQDDSAGKAIKGIMDNPQWYASHECGDIMQASNALSTMAMLIQSELAEEDEDDAHITLLCDGARTLVKFIGGELDELEGAAGDAADTARMGPMNKAVDGILDANGYTQLYGSEIKAIGEDTLRGYAVRFGDSDHADLQKDYYTKSTDFWLDHFGWPRPITYHHGMDAQTRNDPVIGHWLKAGVDDVGVWMEGQMDRAHAYYKAMKELAERGYLRLSSDSAPQWVIREKQQNGVNEIKRWPLVTSSVTVTPMEPRMLPVEVKALMAEIGLEAIDDSPEAINPELARSDATKASDEDRERRLLLEWELFTFEMETA